jgi:hypothetical protein
MTNPFGSYCCSIDINENDTVIAEIKAWLPFHVHVSVGHRRFSVLNKRIECAKKCGDTKAARSWSCDRERLIRILAGQGAFSLNKNLRTMRKFLDNLLTIVFTGSIVLYLVAPLILCLGIDAALILLLWAVHHGFTARKKYIDDLVAMSFGGRGMLNG